jgi:hypothetical protein
MLQGKSALVTGGSAVRVSAVCPWITGTPTIDRLTGHRAEGKRQFAGVNPSGAIAPPKTSPAW